MDGDRGIAELLAEIRDGQRDMLALQREQFAFAKEQYERTRVLHDRAESIQNRQSDLVNLSVRSLKVLLPVIVVLICAVALPIFWM